MAFRSRAGIDTVAITNHRNEHLVVACRTSRRRCANSIGVRSAASPVPRSRPITAGSPMDFPTPPRRAPSSCAPRYVESIFRSRPLLCGTSPAFDPDGKYPLLHRLPRFRPVYDNLQFDLGFPRGVRPYVITLRKDLDLAVYSAGQGRSRARNRRQAKKAGRGRISARACARLEIDLDRITLRRTFSLSVSEGRYRKRIQGVQKARSFSGTRSKAHWDAARRTSGRELWGTLESYSFENAKAGAARRRHI